MEKELLKIILEKCYEISNKAKADVFFDYTPHTSSYSILYCKNGWSKKCKSEYIDMLSEITEENMKKTLKELDKLEVM